MGGLRNLLHAAAVTTALAGCVDQKPPEQDPDYPAVADAGIPAPSSDADAVHEPQDEREDICAQTIETIDDIDDIIEELLNLTAEISDLIFDIYAPYGINGRGGRIFSENREAFCLEQGPHIACYFFDTYLNPEHTTIIGPNNSQILIRHTPVDGTTIDVVGISNFNLSTTFRFPEYFRIQYFANGHILFQNQEANSRCQLGGEADIDVCDQADICQRLTDMRCHALVGSSAVPGDTPFLCADLSQELQAYMREVCQAPCRE